MATWNVLDVQVFRQLSCSISQALQHSVQKDKEVHSLVNCAAVQVDAALDENNQALVATLIKVLFPCSVC